MASVPSPTEINRSPSLSSPLADPTPELIKPVQNYVMFNIIGKKKKIRKEGPPQMEDKGVMSADSTLQDFNKEESTM